jgi:hypothetical protein
MIFGEAFTGAPDAEANTVWLSIVPNNVPGVGAAVYTLHNESVAAPLVESMGDCTSAVAVPVPLVPVEYLTTLMANISLAVRAGAPTIIRCTITVFVDDPYIKKKGAVPATATNRVVVEAL